MERYLYKILIQFLLQSVDNHKLTLYEDDMVNIIKVYKDNHDINVVISSSPDIKYINDDNVDVITDILINDEPLDQTTQDFLTGYNINLGFIRRH
jgi:hypothetical protein